MKNKGDIRLDLCIYLLQIALCFTLISSTYTAGAQQHQITFERIEKTNTQTEIMSALEDENGFLWFGQVDGLFQYNGIDFKPFVPDPADASSLTHGRPMVLANGTDHAIWIGTNSGGISRLDLNTYKFETLRHLSSDSNSLGGNNIGGIYVEDSGIIWVGSNDYCLNKVDWVNKKVTRYYDTNRVELIQESRYLGRIVQDFRDKNILWIGSYQGVYRFNKQNGQFRLFPFSAYNLNYKPHPVAIHCDKNGTVWAGSMDGLVAIQSATGQMELIPMEKIDYRSHARWFVSAIIPYTDSTLLIQTHNDGLIVFNTYTHRADKVNNDPGLGKGSNFCFIDKLGNIWLRRGPALLRGRSDRLPVQTISLKHIPGANWSRAFLPVANKNELFIGTLSGSGLLHVDFDKQRAMAFPYAFDPLEKSDVFMQDLAWGPDSSIYIASSQGLLNFDVKTQTYQKTVDPNKQYRWDKATSVSIRDSIVWFSSLNEGLFRMKFMDPEDIEHYPVTATITRIRCGEEYIWVGTESGCFQLHRNSGDMNMIIPNIHVTDFYQWDDTLWVSSLGEGLFQVFPGLDPKVKHHVSDAGGGTNYVYSFMRDKSNEFWLSTDGGTVRYKPETGSYINLRELGDGKRSPSIQLPGGHIVTGGFGSMSYYLPQSFEQRGLPPKLYISNINISNREENFAMGPNHVDEIILAPHERELFIEFDAINFNSVSSTEFHYRVLGLEDNWKNIKNQRFLSLNNLKPRDYKLELRAMNIYGGKSDTIKSITIRVLPPFYQRLWVQVLFVFLLLSIGLAIYWRLAKMARNKLYSSTVEYFANSRYAENSVDEILWDMARNVISRLGFEHCVVYLYNKDSKLLVQKAAQSILHSSKGEWSGVEIKHGEGVVGTAAARKSPVIVSDLSENNWYTENTEMQGSEISVPILHQGEVLGVINSRHSKKGYFKRAHVDVLSQIAKECAHKIAEAEASEIILQRGHDLLAMQKQIAESRLTALQAQMNPHFIFNSLNSINWYILKSRPAEASIYLTKFSKLVRLILDNSKNLSIPLDEELKALRLYLDLECMRFDNIFDYKIQTDDEIDLEEVCVPPLILQPFVENAIWHGFMNKEEKGHLLIQLYLENDQLKCIVQDDGVGRHASQRLKPVTSTQHKSKGIKLTTDRINLLRKDYLKEDMVRVIDMVDDTGQPMGTRVEVSLPYDDE